MLEYYHGDSDDERSSLDSSDFRCTSIGESVSNSAEIKQVFDVIVTTSNHDLPNVITCESPRKSSKTSTAAPFIQVAGLILSIGSIALYIAMGAHNTSSHKTPYFPTVLLEKGKYRAEEFKKPDGVTIPYWQEVTSLELKLNKRAGTPHVGPCYLPKSEPDWNTLTGDHKHENAEKKMITFTNEAEIISKNDNDLAGLCRPGFIIIGAGKCGTSSLYHYLAGHPRVLAAKNKQIDYYRYFGSRSMKWYLSNFPTAESFLSSGALMTGEASPGYLPYPEIAHRLLTQTQAEASSGGDLPAESPKIITIVRNPLERSWSSYQYNYKKPVINKLRGEIENPESHDFFSVVNKRDKCYEDQWYHDNYVFTFEEMVKAELKLLKECLIPGGDGETKTRDVYASKDWATPEFERREAEGLPGLISLDAACYGDIISDQVPRRQWQDLVDANPNKVINLPNLHVVQSIVGRSLYTFPLEWWHALYAKEDLHIVCNEDLKYRATETMSDVSDFLGLPSFDFTDVTKAGMFNTGDNTGYNTATKWQSDAKPAQSMANIPISDELRKEYMDFVRPYNERLFELTGKRCDW